MSDLSGLFPRVWRDFRREFAHFLAYDLCFKVLGSAVIAPIAGWAAAALLSAGGRLSVGNAELLSFTLSPIGLTTLFVSAAVTLALVFAGQAGLTAMGSIQRAGKEVHVWTVDERAALSDAEKLLLAFGNWLRS